tara:strand:+ start:803 stop:1021 length:219 start_codon:yes stop_codon:yes gene_type:complete
MLIVKRNGKLEEFDSTKLIKIINSKYASVKTLEIINRIEKELRTRFVEFYPNTDNIRDLVEKYVFLEKNKRE